MGVGVDDVIDDHAVDFDRDAAADLQNADPVVAITAFVRLAGIGGQYVGTGVFANPVGELLASCDQAWLFVATPV